jgi:hypothetical protein
MRVREFEITDYDFNRGGPDRALPYAFTQHGIAMLSRGNAIGDRSNFFS